MIRYDTRSAAPHLVVELKGTVSEEEVQRELAQLPGDLASFPDAFVALVLYSEVGLYEADAVGPLFGFFARLFDAGPGLCVFVDGGQSPHPGLRTFIEKVGLEDQVVFVRTRNEANQRIQRHLQRRS